MELGALLIKLGVDACRMPDDVLVPVVGARGTRCDENSLRLGTQLTTMLTDPSTPLDASWLAASVMPFVETQLRREAIHRRDWMWGHEGWEDRVERALRGSCEVRLGCSLDECILRVRMNGISGRGAVCRVRLA